MYATADNANCLSQLKTVTTMQDHAAKIESHVIDLLLSKCQVNIYIKLDEEHLNNINVYNYIYQQADYGYKYCAFVGMLIPLQQYITIGVAVFCYYFPPLLYSVDIARARATPTCMCLGYLLGYTNKLALLDCGLCRALEGPDLYWYLLVMVGSSSCWMPTLWTSWVHLLLQRWYREERSQISP